MTCAADSVKMLIYWKWGPSGRDPGGGGKKGIMSWFRACWTGSIFQISKYSCHNLFDTWVHCSEKRYRVLINFEGVQHVVDNRSLELKWVPLGRNHRIKMRPEEYW